MPKLPPISGDEAIKAFSKLGYVVVRQKGSHVRLLHPSDKTCLPLMIPRHRHLGIGLLRKLIRDANITPDVFLKLLP